MDLMGLHRVDAAVGEAVRQTIDNLPRADTITRSTTDLGSMFMVGSSSATLWALGRRTDAVEVLAAGTLGWAVANEVKKVFDRPRPYQGEDTRRLINPPMGSSMPSGHSAVVFAVTTVLGHQSLKDRRWPWPLIGIWVPLTRIHLGVHYPADTMAGAAIGYGLGRAVVAVRRRLANR